MITCPWCGTNYTTFQPDCQKCGGPMPIPAAEAHAGQESASLGGSPLMPLPPPRPIADHYAWRLLFGDGWAIAASVFILLGAIFTVVGGGLTLLIVTAFVGIPFLGMGILFFVGGAAVAIWRYQDARMTVEVLRTGQAVEGQVSQVEENLSVTVNGRHPWVIHYQFPAGGQTWEGSVRTLNSPGPALQPGRRACVLYLAQSPARNSLYPHP